MNVGYCDTLSSWHGCENCRRAWKPISPMARAFHPFATQQVSLCTMKYVQWNYVLWKNCIFFPAFPWPLSSPPRICICFVLWTPWGRDLLFILGKALYYCNGNNIIWGARHSFRFGTDFYSFTETIHCAGFDRVKCKPRTDAHVQEQACLLDNILVVISMNDIYLPGCKKSVKRWQWGEINSFTMILWWKSIIPVWLLLNLWYPGVIRNIKNALAVVIINKRECSKVISITLSDWHCGGHMSEEFLY